MTQVAGDILSFGPFTLWPAERLLTRGDVQVDLGSRAFDILAVLASRPNETVGKRELLQQVWPDVTVEEGSLRFHVTNLRKALGDGRDGARYISTLPGRGYCFVAPITRSRSGSADSMEPSANWPRPNLPGRLHRMIGRADDLGGLTSLLTAKRFVTIVGTGGVGKTTLAVAAGHDLTTCFEGAVHFIDLGALSDACQVATTMASVLGLSIQSDDAVRALVAYLADRRTLLILDTCEHVIDAAACIASRIFAEAPEVHILATSRQPLQVQGEHLYKIAPLGCPPDESDLSAADAIAFPATELFLERAAAGGADLDLDDGETAIVANICRKLDGVPLAIELVAGRVASYGIGRTAELLEERLAALWPGQRTAPPRQKTLQATLDWSYGQLSELERLLLRRLAVFVGHFSLDAALSVVSDGAFPEALVFEAFDNLITKSMVATRPAGAAMRYRLLDTTRAYVHHLVPLHRDYDSLAVGFG
jgi:predicted ATPase/DNA-binding winged helix-turn-helix (wHTH) protein